MSVFLQEGEVLRMDYRKLIIELVSQSDDQELLELIYRFAKRILG